ncbi:MAG: YugE family protein [Bacillus sp. (in: Bacteria)]|nr:YugE family protein [Bacillus sp. (in: firmicutes)]
MRKEIQTNLQYVDVLNEWDPFCLGESSYETEIADTIQAIHELNDSSELAEKIQRIYEFSFEKIIPQESCLKIAEELLAIKENDSCSI